MYRIGNRVIKAAYRTWEDCVQDRQRVTRVAYRTTGHGEVGEMHVQRIVTGQHATRPS